MKIAYLARRPIPSVNANSVQIVKMCAAFARLGHEVTLFAHRGDGPASSVFDRYGIRDRFRVKIFPKHIRMLKRRRFLVRMLASREIWNADLFFGRDISSLAAVAMFGKPLIYEAHALPAEDSPRRQDLAKLIARPNFSHLVCVTSTLADLHRKHFPALAGKTVIVAPNAGTNLDQPVVRPRRSAGRVQVGFVGRPFRGKGIEVMQAAAKRLPDVDFHVVGADACNLPWIEGQIPPNLHLHGYQAHSAIVGYLARFDIAVAPYGAHVHNASGKESAAITSPLKLLEYMAAGLPCIVSDLPGVRDIIGSRTVALLVPPDDEDAFVAAVARLARDPELRDRLGRAARASFLEHHTVDARARLVLAPVVHGQAAMPTRIFEGIESVSSA